MLKTATKQEQIALIIMALGDKGKYDVMVGKDQNRITIKSKFKSVVDYKFIWTAGDDGYYRVYLCPTSVDQTKKALPFTAFSIDSVAGAALFVLSATFFHDNRGNKKID